MAVRRFFQFRLRTLLIAVTLASLALGAGRRLWNAHRLDELLALSDMEFIAPESYGESRVISSLHADYVRATGGEVWLRPRDPDLYSKPFSDDAIGLIPSSSSLTRIELTGPDLSSDGFAQLSRFADLRVLRMHSANASPTAQSLAGLTQLRELRVTYGPIDNSALASLRNMPLLRILDLSTTDTSYPFRSPPDINDVGAKAIGKSRQLEHLLLPYRGLTDEHVRHFAGLRRLKTLSLAHNNLTGAALKAIGQLESLEQLEIDGIRDVRDSLQHLTSLRNLRSLSLRGAYLESYSLAPLAKLPCLLEIDLSYSYVEYGKVSIDELLVDICQFKQLRRLVLCDTALTDDSVALLVTFKDLDELLIQETLDGDGLDTLEASLPGTRIERFTWDEWAELYQRRFVGRHHQRNVPSQADARN